MVFIAAQDTTKHGSVASQVCINFLQRIVIEAQHSLRYRAPGVDVDRVRCDGGTGADLPRDAADQLGAYGEMTIGQIDAIAMAVVIWVGPSAQLNSVDAQIAKTLHQRAELLFLA